MKVAGLLAGLVAILRQFTQHDATPHTCRTRLKLYVSTRPYLSGKDLLIRRSWDRSPPGSYCRTTTYSAEPHRRRAPLAGEVAGLCAESARDRVPVHLQLACWKVFA